MHRTKLLHVDNCSPNFGAWQMKRIERYYTSIVELFPAPYKGEIYSDKASRTIRRYRTLVNDKTELEILSENSLCPRLFTKLCINFCINIFEKIYKLLLLQRYLYVLVRSYFCLYYAFTYSMFYVFLIKFYHFVCSFRSCSPQVSESFMRLPFHDIW